MPDLTPYNSENFAHLASEGARELPIAGDTVEVDVTGRDYPPDYVAATVEKRDDAGYTVRINRTGERIGAVRSFRFRGVERYLPELEPEEA